MTKEKTLTISQLSLILNKKPILTNINLEVDQGEIIGIIGRNGSGKSMLLKTLAQFYLPDRGKVTYDEEDLFINKKTTIQVGALIENPGFLPRSTGYQNLKLLADIQRTISKEEILKAMKEVGLEEAVDTKVKHYSLGMKQRLGIAQAFMENQKIILLDEPTNGLDKEGVADVHKLLLKLAKEQGATIIIASHIAGDIENLADRTFEMDNGSLQEVTAV